MCSHVYEIKDATPKQVDGTLKEITSVDIVKKAKKIEVAKTQSLEDLLKIAENRGYKPEWANHIYMSRIKKLEKLQGMIAPPPPPSIDLFTEKIDDDLDTDFNEIISDFNEIIEDF